MKTLHANEGISMFKILYCDYQYLKGLLCVRSLVMSVLVMILSGHKREPSGDGGWANSGHNVAWAWNLFCNICQSTTALQVTCS